VQESMKLFDSLSAKEKEKIMFIHFNHTNPLLNEQSEEARLVKSKGFRIAKINFQITL
jgi:pyrroloquinoline quinone biosynthesis protein B